MRHGRVLRWRRGSRCVHAGAAGCVPASAAVRRSRAHRAPRRRHRRDAQERRAACPVLDRRGTDATTVSARAVARLGGVLLGALVFVAALAIWEAWARSAESFFLPPASEVALRAWD